MIDSSLLSGYRLTRNFAIGALVVTVLAAVVSVQAHRHLLTSQLLETIERSAAVQARTIADSPWPRFAYFIHSAERLEAAEIRSYWQTEDLRRDIGDLLAGTKVLNVRLHDARGRTVFSTDEAEIGGNRSADPGLRAALAGDNASRLALAEGWVLSSYVPLRSPDTDGVAGVVEVHSDVSDLEPYLAQAGTGGTGLIVGASAIVFVLLLAMVWLERNPLSLNRIS